jgi:hypothetical protein
LNDETGSKKLRATITVNIVYFGVEKWARFLPSITSSKNNFY